MKLMKIKDSYMFREKDPRKLKDENAAHWYFVYDRHRPVYVRELTHLYIPDGKRFHQLKNGELTKVKVSSFETPNGLYGPKFKNAEGDNFSMRKIKKNTVEEKKRFRYRKVKPSKIE